MADDCTAVALAPLPASETPDSYDWTLVFQVLGDLLTANDGIVSSTELRRELEHKLSISDAHPVVVKLKFFNPESSLEHGIPVPSFKFLHHGRSFTQRQSTTRN